jgi:hypothetical protein
MRSQTCADLVSWAGLFIRFQCRVTQTVQIANKRKYPVVMSRTCWAAVAEWPCHNLQEQYAATIRPLSLKNEATSLCNPPPPSTTNNVLTDWWIFMTSCRQVTMLLKVTSTVYLFLIPQLQPFQNGGRSKF